MKYILLLPIIGFYLVRDIATLLAHEDLVRGLALFILTFFTLLFFTAWLNIARELSKVRKQIGGKTFDWMLK